MTYIIELTHKDEEEYEVKEYLMDFGLDNNMCLVPVLTENPLNAKFFNLIDTESWKSAFKFLRNSMKGYKIAIRMLEVKLS